MAQQAGDVAVLQAYSSHEPSSGDALEAATIAENALDANAVDRCTDALEFGYECVAAVSRRQATDHFHVPMRNLEVTVDRARMALEADHDRAEERAQQAITALRLTVVAVDDNAEAAALGHRYL